MFIKKLSQNYKPRRVLYYREISDEEMADFEDGRIADDMQPYINAFGTYDQPGLYFVREGLDSESSGPAEPNGLTYKRVIGVEYRLDDDRISYPDGLKTEILDEAFFYAIEIDESIEMETAAIRDVFQGVAANDDAHRLCTHLSIVEEPRVISVYVEGKKTRLHYEWQVYEDTSLRVMKDDHEAFDKKTLYEMAFTDPITGHYTWYHLAPYLENPSDAGIQDYAFAHFDVKEFHILNEVYGHVAANRVLTSIVKEMNEADFVYSSARCHNDNFAMLIRDMPEEEMISTLERFFEKLSRLEEEENYTIFFRCGVVPMQRSLLLGNRVADAAKAAQALGRSPNKTDIVMYTDRMHDDAMWSSYIKAYVDTAIENDEFVVYLQPKFEIQEEVIHGAEALIRWNYKNEEFLPPYRFIPFFEVDGSIGKIDDIVLTKVCQALAKWKQEGLDLYPISVNLSRSRLYDRTLIDHLTEIVDEYQVDHSLIDFELTESASYDNQEQMLQVLNELRNRGFKTSMDDFGTGYSSLSLLTELPFNTLKIDKSFVDKIGTGDEKEKDHIVLRYIISLAKELDFTCLAEGAEEKEQVDELRELGCEIIQGYYYSKPIPMEEYEEKYLRQ